MKIHKQPLLSPLSKKNPTGKASDYQWYLLPGVSMQSCILVVATKQIYASHNCIINGPLSLYRKNKIFCPEDSRRKAREIKKF